MGTILNVRMAHLFGVLHFLLNYIPTAGPIIATVIPLPIIVLDPQLSLTAKIAAFVGPTAVHMVIGNFVRNDC
jgi:AI-2 transport protein TqsA